MDESPEGDLRVHAISVVVPVYQGERTLPDVIDNLMVHSSHGRSPSGHSYQVTEVLLVHDNGPDRSADTIRDMAKRHDFVRPIWLSRNFGQHAATLAGMSSAGGDWIITMDEDGQHDPAYIPAFLDTAIAEQATLVYAKPINDAPHGASRNVASGAAKWLFVHALGNRESTHFSSYRLVLGEVGRSVAAYAGSGVFLDVALGWVSASTAVCPVSLRQEGDRRSGYSWRRLLSHFWRLVLSSGTRGLRIVSILGVLFAVVGLMLAVFVAASRATGRIEVEGWTSVMIAVLVGTGAILFALGVVAEYVGVAVNMAMGKPLYLIVSDPDEGPLGAGWLSPRR